MDRVPVLHTELELEDLVKAFIACTLPREQWTHLAHLTVGLWHVDRYDADEALARLRVGIRRLNDSHGTVNSDTGGYHETITRAYVVLLAEFNEWHREGKSLAERAARLLGSPLAAKEALLTFYLRQTLVSTEARIRWVTPDLTPLQLAHLDRHETA